jgi:hypothetical protein
MRGTCLAGGSPRPVLAIRMSFMQGGRRKDLLVTGLLAALVICPAWLGIALAQEDAPQPSDYPPGSEQAQAGSVDGEYREVPGLGPARLTDSGLIEVLLPDGTVITTHGSDEPAGDLPSSELDAITEAYSIQSLNPPQCVENPLFFRILYSHPRDKNGRPNEAREIIREAVRKANDVIHRDGLDYSNEQKDVDLRVKCEAGGGIDVGQFNSTVPSDDDSFARIVGDARERGFDNPGVKYVIFWDSPRSDACGTGQIADDDRRNSDNAHNNFAYAQYSVVYGQACWENGRTPLHEMGHNMGAVQKSAPHNADGFHCDEGREADILCTTGSGSSCGLQRFDCGHDDYFDPQNPSNYLSQKWQVGWKGNEGVSIGDR